MNRFFLVLSLSALTGIVLFLVSLIITENTVSKVRDEAPLFKALDSVSEFDTTKLVIYPREEETEILTIATEIEDYVSSQKQVEENISKPVIKPTCTKSSTQVKRVKKIFHDKQARLAIIMDDIGNANQVKAFKNIPFTMTPSIFPATARHPNTPTFAKEFKHYMVHMPMEAFHFSTPEDNTLDVSDSKEEVEEKIAAMYQDFPDAIAINNHTGSKFTSSEEAMDKLFCALDKYDINFIDSKTAPHTKAVKIGKLHNKIVLVRHVFLDNEPDVDYILNQLKQAVRYAKKHGVAIAICHPRPETFQAFKEAAFLLEDVKMVSIDELY